jgi:hypothetical protein
MAAFLESELFITFIAFFLSTLAAIIGFVFAEILRLRREKKELKRKYYLLLRISREEIFHYGTLAEEIADGTDTFIKMLGMKELENMLFYVPHYGISTLLLEETRAELARMGLNLEMVMILGRCHSSLLAINEHLTTLRQQISPDEPPTRYIVNFETIRGDTYRLIPFFETALRKLDEELTSLNKTYEPHYHDDGRNP